MTPNKLLIVCSCIIIMCMIGISSGEVIISSPGSGVYDAEIINIQVNPIGNYTNVQLIYASNPQIPEDLYEFAGMYVSLEKDLSEWTEGTHNIAARAYNVDSNIWDWSDNVSITIIHTAIDDVKPAMRIIGMSKGMTISENKTRLISVVDNQTGVPLKDVTIYIMQDASTLCNTYTTTISGMVKIKFRDYGGLPLENDIYFVRFEKQRYDTIEFEIDIDIEVKDIERPEMVIWGLDRIYNSDIESIELIRVKGSDTNDYLTDVSMKLIHADGTPVTGSKITNTYGMVDFNPYGIQPGEYSIVFEHPDYDTKIVNVEISQTPTPRPTPTPVPTPVFTWGGFTFPSPHQVTLSDGTMKSYTSAQEFSVDFIRVDGETVERPMTIDQTVIEDTKPYDDNKDGGLPWGIVILIPIMIVVVIWMSGRDKIKSMFDKKSIDLPELQEQDTVNMDYTESIIDDEKEE